MTLHLYFARRFAMMLLMVCGAFAAIVVLVELIEQIGEVSKHGAGLPTMLYLSVLTAPATLYRILPLLVLLGAVALFLGLARTSEMVVTRAAGRSALHALMGPLLLAFGLGALAITMGNPIVSATSTRYETLRGDLAGKPPQIATVGENGLWMRQADETGQSVIRANHSNLNGTALVDVSFNRFDASGTLFQRIEARTARLEPGAWRLTGAKIWDLTNPEPEASADAPGDLLIDSDLTAAQIRDSFGSPSSVPLWELPAFIDDLQRAGFTARRHLVWLQTELASPLFLVAMVLTAAGFTLAHQRGGGTGVRTLMAVMAGFGFYFMRNFAMVLGENGQIPVALAAWAPPAMALMLALSLLLTVEDG